VHVVPLHPAPTLVAVSHVMPHPVQFDVVVTGVSHPFVFGAPASQSR
jgi:hypothetical protein